MNIWPNKVWERGEITAEGVQLWYSRPVTREDRVRRELYTARFTGVQRRK